MRQPRHHRRRQAVDAETLAGDIAQHMAFRSQEVAPADGFLLDHAFGGERGQDAMHGGLAQAGIARQGQQAGAVATGARHAAQHLHGARDGLRSAHLGRHFRHIVSVDLFFDIILVHFVDHY